jgi:hypothetical protein
MSSAGSRGPDCPGSACSHPPRGRGCWPQRPGSVSPTTPRCDDSQSGDDGAVISPARLGIFQSTPTPLGYFSAWRLNGDQIESYFQEPKQCCTQGGGDSEAQSGRSQGRNHSPARHRGPEGGNHRKSSNGSEEGGVHSQAQGRGKNRRGRCEESYRSCERGR